MSINSNSEAVTSLQKLTALQEATEVYYHSEYEIPVEMLWLAYQTTRAQLNNENIDDKLKEWKRQLIQEVEGSKFVSIFEIDTLHQKLDII